MDLDRLPEIDWSALEHSYGSAADVPDRLRDLLSPDEEVRARARAALLHSLDHQGIQRWEATACAVPFLVGLVRDPRTPERHGIVHLLAELAVGDVDGKYLLTGFHIDEVCTREGTREYGYFVYEPELRGSRSDLEYGELLRRIYLAVGAGLPTYIELARDGDALLREYAAHLLAWRTAEVKVVVPALQGAMNDERDPACRGSQGMALSYVTLFHRALHAAVRPVLEAALTRASDTLERHLLGAALLLHTDPSPAVREVLVEALQTPSREEHRGPWRLALAGRTLLRNLMTRAPAAWRAEIVAAGCARLRGLTDAHEALDTGEALLAACFERLPEASVPVSYDAPRPVSSHDLDAAQRALLQTLAEAPIAWRFGNMRLALNAYGLPADAESMRRFLAG